MNKTELASAISVKTGMPQDAAVRAVNALTETVINAVGRGDSVTIPGFGTFCTKHRNARKGFNVHTGQKIVIPAADVPVFKPGKHLKDAVNSN